MERKCTNCKYYEKHTDGSCGLILKETGKVVHVYDCCNRHEWSDETINEAVAVVRDELLKHGALYDGFLASVKSALIDYQEDGRVVLNASCDVLSKEILKRIVGE